MKFGQHAAVAFQEFGDTLPEFPYKRLKKALKREDLTNRKIRGPRPSGIGGGGEGSGDEEGSVGEGGTDMRQWFARLLTKETKRIDAVWVAAAKNALLAARYPTAGAAFVKLRGQRWCAEPVTAAEKLAAWAQLSRTGLRKIIKKYNKRCGEAHGHIVALETGTLHFNHGRIRTEILNLAKG